MNQEILVLEESDKGKFEFNVNVYLSEGWTISSTSCGFVNSERYDFCSTYQAILIKNSQNVAVVNNVLNTSVQNQTLEKQIEKIMLEILNKKGMPL